MGGVGGGYHLSILKQYFTSYIFYFFYSLTVSMFCKTLIHFDNTHKDWKWGHGGGYHKTSKQYMFWLGGGGVYHKTSKQYMFVCTSATVCMCVCVCVCVYECAHAHMHMHAWVHTCMHLCMHPHMPAHIVSVFEDWGCMHVYAVSEARQRQGQKNEGQERGQKGWKDSTHSQRFRAQAGQVQRPRPLTNSL